MLGGSRHEAAPSDSITDPLNHQYVDAYRVSDSEPLPALPSPPTRVRRAEFRPSAPQPATGSRPSQIEARILSPGPANDASDVPSAIRVLHIVPALPSRGIGGTVQCSRGGALL